MVVSPGKVLDLTEVNSKVGKIDNTCNEREYCTCEGEGSKEPYSENRIPQ